jgi:hypothetical protein
MDDRVVALMELRPCGLMVVVPVQLGVVPELAWLELPGSPCTHVHTGCAIVVDRLAAAVSDAEAEAPDPAAENSAPQQGAS